MVRTALAAILALSCLATDADARRRHHHHRARHHYVRLHAANVEPERPSFLQRFFGGGSSLVSSARAHIGATASQLGLPSSLWCADFMNQTLRRSGYQFQGTRAARSYLALPHTQGRVGDIAVLSRRGGGHVGVVTGFEGNNPIVVSGNHGKRVGEGVYPRSRVIAYVTPR